MLKKIISGGQTGADRGGLRAGRELGLKTGGWAPKGWKTEKGTAPWLETKYDMQECQKDGYPARTALNIKESDGTVIFGSIEPQHTGSRLTWNRCGKLHKPCCHFDVIKGSVHMVQAPKFFLDWIKQNKIKVLNVAGNRESTNPKITDAVKDFLVRTLKEC